jgi:hypothetical protein
MSNGIVRMAKWMWGLVFENIWWKVLSLAAAMTIWALVATEPELSTFASTQVEYKDLPADIEIDSTPLTTVLLELQGPSGALRNIGEPSLRPQVILDMSAAAPGRSTYAIEDGAVKLPRGVRLVRSIPAQVSFEFDRREVADVPVSVPIAGAGTNGYVVASQSVDPDMMAIVGPASHVAQVTHAVTDPVDVSQATGTATYHVNAYLNDPFVEFQSPLQVVVTVVMKKK